MEKQMAFFQIEADDESTIWHHLPEQNREKIEIIFARVLIKHFNSSLEEVRDHEK